MRIAFITLGYDPVRMSGFDLAGERLVQALLDSGHSVTVLAARRGPVEETRQHPNLTIVRLPLGRSNWIGFSYRAARQLKRLPAFDVVHFYDIGFSYAYRGRFVASVHHSFRQRLEGLGAFSRHGPVKWIVRSLYYRLSQRLAERPGLRRARGLLAVSATTRDAFIHGYGIPPERICLARNCVDTEVFQRVADTTALRQALGLSQDQPVILFVGFITPRKGMEYLAQALARIEPAPCLLIVGKWQSEAYRQQVLPAFEPLRRQVREVGFVPDEMLPAYYSLADVYVSASLMEGFGLPLGEALACQTPVVATNAGASAEVVGPGGLIVPPEDAVALAQAVSRLLQDQPLRLSLGRLGREHIQNQFSVQTLLRDTLAAYQRFLGVDVEER